MSTSALPGYGGVGSSGSSWLSAFKRQPSRKGRVPCYGGRLYHTRFYRKTLVADRYLTDQTRGGGRPGHKLTQLAGHGHCALLFPTTASTLQSPSAADRIRSSVTLDQTESQQLRQMLMRCVVQVASQKGTRRMMNINLLKTIDGDERRRQNRHADTNFYVVSLTRGSRALFHPATETLRADSRAVTYCPEDGRLTLDERVFVVKE
jgi:hypothetical protein